MSRLLARSTMLLAIFAWLLVSLRHPDLLSDRNTFLKSLVGPDLLAVLGIMVTIALGSAANIHFELNKLEERAKSKGSFPKARRALHRSAYSLILLFVAAVVLLVVKGDLSASQSAQQSLVNGGALLIVLFNALVLFDITRMAFVMGPQLGTRADDSTGTTGTSPSDTH
ncbi:hypothetical protein GRI75_12865 [Altererythrobacter soli]|uniref:Uncharacterized protein n=1 Tax=Croceibacterium soli TaxID=1739690 RepID=A0A6I4UUD5_9SPHN|nr:hypothetical protein [Croceibacterium soli]MXP42532.1 hypothetical protein [Croceibacterium soli]